jgi:nucleoside-diphosphate-sugar epimerase
MTERRALVTGGTGFIGSRLAPHLITTGWRVHAIIRPTSDRSALESVCPEVVVHVHDGSAKSMLAIMMSANPAVVFHLASKYLSDHRPDDVESLIRSNLLFGTQLIDAMAQAGITRLVNTGTFYTIKTVSTAL